MKILTNTEYEALIKKNESLNDNNRGLERSNKNLEEEVAKLKKEVENAKADAKVLSDREAMKLEMKVHEATKKMKESFDKLTIENNNYKKEVEILTKAFENMGFDVKDMKEILNKLVDGVVSKNTINVVK